MFKKFVLERNLPECKKLIHDYVDKVIVNKDHIEVIFNVASLLFRASSGIAVVQV